MSIQNLLTSWQTQLNSYLEQLYLSKSGPTVNAYKGDLVQFLEYIGNKGIKRPTALKSGHIISYLGHCKGSGKSEASVHRYYMSIRSFCKYLKRSKAITEDLTEDITAPKNTLKAPRIPTAQEIDRLLALPDTEKEVGARDKAILLLLYSSGLRASELCNLELDDVTADSVLIRCGKRGKTRTVPITDEAYKAIQGYIQRFRGTSQGVLFLTLFRFPVRRQLLGKVISGYAHKIQLEITPHTLRHACATHLLDAGADLRLIQEVLGHSSIASTQRYTHLSSTQMQQKFRQFHRRSYVV